MANAPPPAEAQLMDKYSYAAVQLEARDIAVQRRRTAEAATILVSHAELDIFALSIENSFFPVWP